MKETRFIAQNKEKWLESEKLLASPSKDPEKLTQLFTQVIDDLSFSRTYYPNRTVRVYLNKIARQFFSFIYSHKKERKNRFMHFWLDELPQIIIFSRKQLLVSFLFFTLAVAIGVFSSAKDPAFAASILGEDYMSMTRENIANNDPMAVYKKQHQVDMFLGITLNNLRVAFYTYIFGIFFAIGSLAILLSNGIMLGCFQYFFVQQGLFVQSALSIWLHGTLEISCIIIAGGAGLTLGSGLIFPGTYSRLQSFQLSAIRSLKLMLGISPIIVMAGIIESFLTRYTHAPDILKLLLIILSAAFIIGYFVIYPWRKSISGFEEPLKTPRLAPSITEPIAYDQLKKNADILKDTFILYARHSNKILPWALGTALVLSIARFFLEPDTLGMVYLFDWYETVIDNMVYGMYTPNVPFLLLNTLATTVVLYRVMKLVHEDAYHDWKRFHGLSFLQLALVVGIIYTAFLLGGWTTFLLICVFPLLLLVGFVMVSEKEHVAAALGRSWRLIRGNSRQVGELQITLLTLGFSFLMLASAPLLYLYTSLLEWNFTETDAWATKALHLLEICIKTGAFYLLLPLIGMCLSILYFTLLEIMTADHLKDAIAQLGVRHTKKINR